MKKIKYFLPALIWMIFIFIESAMPGDVSSHQSHFIVDFIYSLLSIPSHYQNMISFIVRKCAHMSEYFILTLFLYNGCVKNEIYHLSIPCFIAFLYACSDEFHQLFISGRAGQIKDIGIDSIGIIIALLCIFFYQKKKSVVKK